MSEEEHHYQSQINIVTEMTKDQLYFFLQDEQKVFKLHFKVSIVNVVCVVKHSVTYGLFIQYRFNTVYLCFPFILSEHRM